MLIIILLIMLLLVIILVFSGIYMCKLAIDSETSNRYFTTDLRLFCTPPSINEKEERKKWLGEYSRTRYIKSFDDLILCGYEIRNNCKSNIWIIVNHGYMCKGLDMIPQTKIFLNMGYNVLIIDQRAHGKSDGKYRGMGYLESKDLIRWINLIVNEHEKSKIILYGISMGAATVMFATAENLPNNVKACIEDCGYTSIWDEFKAIYKKSFKLPTFPILNIANITAKIKAGYSFKEGSVLEAVKKSKIPILFIHGEEDKLVPYNMVEKLYDEASCEKEKISVKNAGHTESSTVDSEFYWNKVRKFINKYT